MRDGNLLLLLLYDLLYGKGIQGGGQVKRLLLAHEPALRAAAEGVETPPPQTPRTEGGGGDGDGGNGRSFPRYARVNPLKLTVAGAVAALVGEKGKKGGAVEKGPATVVVVAREDIQVRPAG